MISFYISIRFLKELKQFKRLGERRSIRLNFNSIESLRNLLMHVVIPQTFGAMNRAVLSSVDTLLKELPQEFLALRFPNSNLILDEKEQEQFAVLHALPAPEFKRTIFR